MSKLNIDRRYRAWTFLVYPDDLPSELDWYTELDELHIPIAISPLHDMLLEGKPGKKDHYHIIFSFDGKKSYDQVNEILFNTLSLNGQNQGFTRPEPVQCLASYYRYLCHLDNDDKVKYDPECIILMGGFNPHKYIEEQSDLFILQMTDFIEQERVIEFCDFVVYCRQMYPDTWYPILRRNTSFFSIYIRSKRYKFEGR